MRRLYIRKKNNYLWLLLVFLFFAFKPKKKAPVKIEWGEGDFEFPEPKKQSPEEVVNTPVSKYTAPIDKEAFERENDASFTTHGVKTKIIRNNPVFPDYTPPKHPTKPVKGYKSGGVKPLRKQVLRHGLRKDDLIYAELMTNNQVF